MKQDGTPEIFAFDFDGTIVENKYPDIGEPIASVVEYIKDVQGRGDKWILWTCRTDKEVRAAAEFCESIGLHPNAVNDNIDVIKEKFGCNPRKIYYDYCIDDHNAVGLIPSRELPVLQFLDEWNRG